MVTGPGWGRENHGYLSLPLLVRSNTLLAVGAGDDRPDYDHADNVTLRVYELADGATATAPLYDLHGALSATATRTGQTVRVSVAFATGGATKPWRM